jgi:hypothetical protein
VYDKVDYQWTIAFFITPLLFLRAACHFLGMFSRCIGTVMLKLQVGVQHNSTHWLWSNDLLSPT